MPHPVVPNGQEPDHEYIWQSTLVAESTVWHYSVWAFLVLIQ